MSPANAAYASFEAQWLAAHPEQAAIAAFLSPADRVLANAFGCLVYEIEKAAFGLSEPQIAVVKLAWWRQELLGAAAGNPRHPVSAVLLADLRCKSVDSQLWPALVDGAMRLLEEHTVATVDDLFDHYAALYTPIAQLESDLFDGERSQIAATTRLAIIAQCLRTLPTLASADERSPFPLDLLARHGLTRSMLTRPGASRNSAVRDFLVLLGSRMSDAHAQAGAMTLSRAVRAQLDRALTKNAIAALDPLAWLEQHRPVGRWTSLWFAWSEARRIARAKSTQRRSRR